jgi:drug/metabolite transporter (DMT)-like permease
MSNSAIIRPQPSVVVLLSIALIGISASGPLIALTTAPALAIAFWRCFLGTAFTVPFALKGLVAEVGRVTPRVRWLALGAGVLLGLHFATWIPSLRFTSVASSIALIATQPVWAALIARFRGAYVPRRTWLGIGIALIGVVVLTGVDFSLDPRALIGDALALAGAIFAAAYVTAGQEVRASVSTRTYTVLAYGSAALTLLVVVGLTRTPLSGWSLRDWGLILLLTLVAQILGHTLINVALKKTSATVTSFAILFELPGSIIFAAILLGQVPAWSLVPALVLLFIGLLVVISGSRGNQPVEESPI